MREAAIISTARTGLAKAMRGGFNKTHGITMGGHTVKHAIERAGIESGEVEDIIFGCGQPEAATGHNIGRNVAIAGDVLLLFLVQQSIDSAHQDFRVLLLQHKELLLMALKLQ